MYTTTVLLLIFQIISAPLVLSSVLDPEKLQAHLHRGEPILGNFCPSSNPMANWMAGLPDSTLLTEMGIPGTHDSATWNYTGDDAPWFRCQDSSLFSQLNDGVRLIDLRIGFEGNSTTKLVFFHANALLNPTAQLNDIFYGLYTWMEHHPKEAVFVSIKVDNGSTTSTLQNIVYDLMTTEPGNNFWFQSDELPKDLGAARGKLIYLARLAGPENVAQPIGLPVFSGWRDNDANFSIEYLPDEFVFIEDLYLLDENSLASVVETKFDALTAHILSAVSAHDQLYFSFASASGNETLTPDATPKGLAVGSSEVVGVNERLFDFLQTVPRKATLGFIFLDFYESDPKLVELISGYSSIVPQ